MSHQTSSAAWLDPVVEAYSRHRPLLLLFDYDGTLSPTVRHPSLALLPPSTRDLLVRLAALPRVTLGVVSGRALEEVRHLVPLHGCYYAGSSGLEMDLLGEHRQYPLGAEFEDTLSAIHESLLDLLRDHPGTWVERKPLSLAVHFRGLLPLAAVCFRSAVAARLATVPQVRFRVVSEAFEVTPSGGWDKGTAVGAVLDGVRERHIESPLPVFFGDAANDEEAMATSLMAGGFAVGVGPEAPQVAVHRVSNSDALAAQLEDLYRRLATVAGVPVTPEPAEADTPIEVGRSGLLVVDPDAEHRDRLCRAMRQFGWRVWGFATAAEADRALTERADEVRAVLVDLDQPGLAGGRLLARWGQSHPAVARCGMAGVSPYMASAFRRMSGLPLLAKPVDAGESNRQLRRLMADAVTADQPV
jgi:trehalose 6-phosphate phosphatase